MSNQKKVVVHWDATGLRAVPDEIRINSRTEILRWELESTRRGARISDVAFEEGAAGPFCKVEPHPSSDVVWQSQGSAEQPFDRRYKYSVYVTDTSGAVIELDPFVVDTDKP